MVEYPDEKAAVDELIETLGTDITYYSQTTETYSEDTGWSEGFSASSSIKAATYNIFGNFVSYQQQGNLDSGALNLVIKGDQSMSEKDKVVYADKIYTVTSINPLPIGETTLAKIVVCDERLAIPAVYVDLTDSEGAYLLDANGDQLQVLEV